MLREGRSVGSIALELYGDASVRGRRRVYSILSKLRRRGLLPAELDPISMKERFEEEILQTTGAMAESLSALDEERLFKLSRRLTELGRKAAERGYFSVGHRAFSTALRMLEQLRRIKKERDLEELRDIAKEIVEKDSGV